MELLNSMRTSSLNEPIRLIRGGPFVARQKSRHGVFRERPHIGMPETEDDILLRHSGLFELAHDADIGVVGLNPDLAVDNIDVGDHTVHSAYSVPSFGDHQVPIGFLVIHWP